MSSTNLSCVKLPFFLCTTDINFQIQKATTEGHKNPAIVFGVTNVDSEIYFQGGGTQTFKDDTSPKVDPDSVFWLCSQTKLITAVCLYVVA